MAFPFYLCLGFQAEESSRILDSVWSRAADWAAKSLGHRQLARYYQTKARLGSKAAAS